MPSIAKKPAQLDETSLLQNEGSKDENGLLISLKSAILHSREKLSTPNENVSKHKQTIYTSKSQKRQRSLFDERSRNEVDNSIDTINQPNEFSFIAIVHNISFDALEHICTFLLTDTTIQTPDEACPCCKLASIDQGVNITTFVQKKCHLNFHLNVVQLVAYKRRDVVQAVFQGRIKEGDAVFFHNVEVATDFKYCPVVTTNHLHILAHFRLRNNNDFRPCDSNQATIASPVPCQFKALGRCSCRLQNCRVKCSFWQLINIPGVQNVTAISSTNHLNSIHKCAADLVFWYCDLLKKRKIVNCVIEFPTIANSKRRRISEICSSNMISDVVVEFKFLTKVNHKQNNKITLLSFATIADGEKSEDRGLFLWQSNSGWNDQRAGNPEGRLSTRLERLFEKAGCHAKLLLRAILSVSINSILYAHDGPRPRSLKFLHLQAYLQQYSFQYILVPTCGTSIVDLVENSIMNVAKDAIPSSSFTGRASYNHSCRFLQYPTLTVLAQMLKCRASLNDIIFFPEDSQHSWSRIRKCNSSATNVLSLKHHLTTFGISCFLKQIVRCSILESVSCRTIYSLLPSAILLSGCNISPGQDTVFHAKPHVITKLFGDVRVKELVKKNTGHLHKQMEPSGLAHLVFRMLTTLIEEMVELDWTIENHHNNEDLEVWFVSDVSISHI